MARMNLVQEIRAEGGARVAPRSEQIPALDGLRGIACLFVVLAHVQYLGFANVGLADAGALGVSIFFSLSGFLMAYLYAKAPFNMQTVAPYAVNRFARIAPVYLLVILASWLIRSEIDPKFVYDINNHNVARHLLFSGSEAVFWSIPPEVQFYVFFIGLWWAIYRATAGSFLPLAIMFATSLAMVAFSGGLPGTTLPTKLTFFLFGSLAGLISAHVRDKISLPVTALVAQVILFCAVVAWLNLPGKAASPYESLPYAILCMMLIFAFSLPSSPASAVFGSRALAALGKWSFAIYLIHEPCLYVAKRLVASGYLTNGLGLALGIVLTLGVAFLLHICVERPAQRRLKAVSRLFKPRPAGGEALRRSS
jgi:peptidoglycan/LPS O-acetylase OafA/YrhL